MTGVKCLSCAISLACMAHLMIKYYTFKNFIYSKCNEDFSDVRRISNKITNVRNTGGQKKNAPMTSKNKCRLSRKAL